VFDEDRVALNAMKFSSPLSAGASCMVHDGNGATSIVDASMDQVLVRSASLVHAHRLKEGTACHAAHRVASRLTGSSSISMHV
jgi:hypothetical protein